jgi:hypothetical protein
MDNKYVTYGLAGVALLLLVLSIFAFTTRISKDDSAAAVKAAQDAKDAEAKAQLDALQVQVDTKLGELNTKISGLQTQVDAKTAQITELQTTAATNEDLSAKLAILEEEKAALVQKVKDLTEEATGLSALGKLIDNLKIGDTVSFDLDNSDVDKLLDTTITFIDDSYDVEEKFSATSNLKLTSNGLGADEKFADKPYLIVADEGTLVYTYTFKDPIDFASINSEDSLDIVLLGQAFKIVDADASEIKVEVGQKVFLHSGEQLEVAGKVLKLIAVSENDKALVDVSGTQEAIAEGASKTVNGLKIKVTSVFPSGNSNTGFEELIVGTDVSKTLEDGDSEYFGANDEFVFNILTSGSDLTGFTVTYNVKSDELEDDVAPLSVGGKIEFPNKYLTVEFKRLSKETYKTLDLTFVDKDAQDDLLADSKMVLLTASDSIIKIDTEEVKKLYIHPSGDLYYVDNNNDFIKATATIATIDNGDYELDVTLDAGKVKLTDSYGKVVKVHTDIVNEKLGALVEEAEATDVKYDGQDFGTLEYDVLTSSGLVIVDVENNANNDEVSFKIPSTELEADIEVY